MAPTRRGLLLLLVLLVLSGVVFWAVFWLKGNKGVDDGVDFIKCSPGQYNVNGSCETCPNGTYTDQFNNWTKCKPCNQECGLYEELVSECSSTSNRQCQCIKGRFKDSNHTEACVLCSSCENGTVLTECSPTSDRVCAINKHNIGYLSYFVFGSHTDPSSAVGPVQGE